jgi:hypothetical protein
VDLFDIETKRAKDRQIRKPSDSVPPMLAEQTKGEARDKVADKIGMKHTTFTFHP